MTIITQQRALINYDRITSISVVLQSKGNTTDETSTKNPMVKENTETNTKEIGIKEKVDYHYCIVADETYVLGTYNSQSDALKVLTSIIGNAIIGNYPCVVLPFPEEVDEAVEVVKKEFTKD